VIIGTAGHIDHGKTSLVRTLTGVDTDRLKEEKARGISIELGYAYTPLSNGDVLGFVDVPGHERLVHTMAAGACGIDFALLVVAADDGVMPQTREHVAILQLFGVTRGAVAITKVDRVDAGRVREVEVEVRGFLADTVFRGVPVFWVSNPAAVGQHGGATRGGATCSAGDARADGSAKTNDSVGDNGDEADGAVGIGSGVGAGSGIGAGGVGALRRHLERVAVDLGRRGDADDAGLFRLAVDRVFTLAGQGTVVAGTVFSGRISVGDNLVVFPSKTPARVRSIHAQNHAAEMGHSGQRCALTLAGIEKHDVRRGDWLADERVLSPTKRIDVRLELLSTTGGVLKAWSPVHFHHGAAHVQAHAVPLDDSAIHAGQTCYAQIVFDAPMCAVPGDRFVLRDAQALHTLGGGIVVDPYAPAR
jgi:selenocysteine-specific elongation factor